MSRLRHALETRSQPDMASLESSGAWGQGMVWHGAPGASQIGTAQAMRLTAVFACIRLLSEAVATLPLGTFIREQGTRHEFPTPDYLAFNPPCCSRIDYLSQLMLSLLTDGNAYVLTPRDELGVPMALVVLDPASITVRREHGVTTYTCNNIPLDPRVDLVHIKGMMMPGSLSGLSPISYARESIAVGLSAQRFGSAFFENGALPSAVIEAAGDFSKEAAERFGDSWNTRHAGIGNAQKVGVLTGGAKLNRVSIAPNDAQFLETRAFQVADVARIYGVPPHLIADASNSTSWGSGLEEQNLAFGQFSLRPWTERIEDAHTRLLTTHGLSSVFVKLNLDALLRASLKDRYASYSVAGLAAFLTINEMRQLEDLPPVPWGDSPYVPHKVTETGMAPADELHLPNAPRDPTTPMSGS